MIGAPTLTGSAGSLLAVLKACLIDGFNSQTITAFTVSSGIATVSFTATPPQYETDQVVQISGNSGAFAATINTEFRVSAITSSSVSFPLALSDGAYFNAGMTIKVAPIGYWTQPYGTVGNVSVFQSQLSTSTKYSFKVDDSIGAYAAINGYSTMWDIQTGADKFPAMGTYTTSAYWRKAYTASASTYQWVLIGDGKTIFFGTSPFDNNILAKIEWNMLGDYVSMIPNDTTNCAVSTLSNNNGGLSAAYTANYFFIHTVGTSLPYNILYGARASNGMTKYPQLGLLGDRFGTSSSETFGINGFQYPNFPNNALELRGNIELLEYSSTTGTAPVFKRGYLRGAYQVRHNNPLNCLDKITLPNGNTGVYLRATDNSNNGCVIFDINGPW